MFSGDNKSFPWWQEIYVWCTQETYGLDGLGIESRWGRDFSHPSRPTLGPTQPTMGTGSFLGVKWPGHGVDHPPPSSAEIKERVEPFLYSPSGPLWPVLWWPLPLFYLCPHDTLLLLTRGRCGQNMQSQVLLCHSGWKCKGFPDIPTTSLMMRAQKTCILSMISSWTKSVLWSMAAIDHQLFIPLRGQILGEPTQHNKCQL